MGASSRCGWILPAALFLACGRSEAAAPDPTETAPSDPSESATPATTESASPDTPAHAAVRPSVAVPSTAPPSTAAPSVAARSDDTGAPSEDTVEPSAAPASATSGLRVAELVVARGIEGRSPVEPGATLSASGLERVYCFATFENSSGAAARVSITFAREGGTARRPGSPVTVPASRRYRTWSWTSQRSPGRWVCAVSDASGAEIGRQAYEITP